jgi:hypothetical protein
MCFWLYSLSISLYLPRAFGGWLLLLSTCNVLPPLPLFFSFSLQFRLSLALDLDLDVWSFFVTVSVIFRGPGFDYFFAFGQRLRPKVRI